MMQEKIKLTNDRYRLGYHVSAPAGWINDPNGFCYYKGYYHIFYQHHPYSADWGPMHWGHARSKDLVHWETLPIAIAPDSPEDEDGCFSGSAIVKDDVLYLIYTGHHYYGDNDPDHFWQNQNMAYSTDGIHFTKYEHNPIIAHPPKDNTHHFRDPKVWQNGEDYYLVLGSQEEDGLGRVIVYHSKDLKEWDYLGKMAKATSRETEGFMWECPDFFTLEANGQAKQILLFSPQGIEPQGEKYRNLFQTGYFVGDYDEEKNHLEHGEFQELDYGHDFYATQTTQSPDGRRLVIGWMDMWESDFPEKEDGWAGALTLPRELTLVDGKLTMQPVQEAKDLRIATLKTMTEEVVEQTLLCSEEKQAEITLTLDKAPNLALTLKDDGENVVLTLQYDAATKKLMLTRAGEDDPRFATLSADLTELHLFMDTSAIEIFVNNGEAVFTERFYTANAPAVWLEVAKATHCHGTVYRLDGQAVTY
ncbi:MAG: sucrose-6-phosphate hydrolase [Aerococcus sp.]|nr:sucrose-6-phosphate hydrolase [Aerococcus sp.]